MTATMSNGFVCPAPLSGATHDRVVLGHGSGGKLSAALLKQCFLPHLRSEALSHLGDGAVVPAGETQIVLSTDSFVVNPLEFPGGNIGTLAVNGTVNDLTMMGATPLYLTVAFIIEEGLPLDLLNRIVESMAAAAWIARVEVVAGDTKVVERGKGDGLFINTTGVGLASADFRPAPNAARCGDVVLISGPIGVHGITILSAREGLEFEADLASDTACLFPLVTALRAATMNRISALRDPTRGGVASTLNEIAAASRVGVVIDEASLPIPAAVTGACEMLGLDPLYVANEGNFVAFVPPDAADAALGALRSHPLGREARKIGVVVDDHPGMVVMRTGLGGTRIVDLLPGDQLPRIC
jgi:hydrogenase expression/formation protein HypE